MSEAGHALLGVCTKSMIVDLVTRCSDKCSRSHQNSNNSRAGGNEAGGRSKRGPVLPATSKVGGHALLNTIDVDGIHQRVVFSWPQDKPGEVIKPERDIDSKAFRRYLKGGRSVLAPASRGCSGSDTAVASTASYFVTLLK